MAKGSADKLGFDVYGMLTILTTILMGGACYLLYDDLNANWGFTFGEKPSAKHATRLTEYRQIGANSPYVMLRKEDREDWDNISEANKGGKEFPVKDYEWPAGYDPIKFPVQPAVNNWAKTLDSQEGDKWKAAFEALLSTADKEPVPEAPKTPDPEKPAETPATPPTDAPKTDAPTTDAPKTDAAKTEEPKADAAKTDEVKKE